MGIRHAEHGPVLEQFVGERLEPAEQYGFLSIPAHGWRCQLEQVRRSLETPASQRVADRIGRRTVLLVPLARAPMQSRDLIGLLRHQVHMKDIGKKMV